MTRFFSYTKQLLFFCVLALSLGSIRGVAQETIAIFTFQAAGAKEWDPDSIQSGIAGSEEAVIYISEQLANLGYKVTVFGCPPAHSRHSKEKANPRFVPQETFDASILYDIAISWRMPALAQELKQCARHVYFWPHDHPPSMRLAKEQIEAFDDVLWLSKWQRGEWVKQQPLFSPFTKIFGNGINPKQFGPISKRKNPYSCIYGSNYGRGLDVLLDAWPKVRARFPKAILDIYYGWQHWGLLSQEQEQKLKRQIAELSTQGVKEHGQVGHKKLHEAFAEASFWTYPCTGIETFSITALKAQMAGAIPVIVEGSALAETATTGYRCSFAEQYAGTLIQAMEQAHAISKDTREQGRHFVLERFTWEKMAKAWQGCFIQHKQQPISSP